MTKKQKHDLLPAVRRALNIKAAIVGAPVYMNPDGTGVTIVPKMSAKLLDKLISDTISPREKKRYILALAAAHGYPKKITAKKLHALAEKCVIGPMLLKTFQNKISKE
jgi:hypothetical protein